MTNDEPHPWRPARPPSVPDWLAEARLALEDATKRRTEPAPAEGPIRERLGQAPTDERTTE